MMNIEQELRRNIKELQEQLQRAYGRIKILDEELRAERKKAYHNERFRSSPSGWALMEDHPEYPTDDK